MLQEMMIGHESCHMIYVYIKSQIAFMLKLISKDSALQLLTDCLGNMFHERFCAPFKGYNSKKSIGNKILSLSCSRVLFQPFFNFITYYHWTNLSVVSGHTKSFAVVDQTILYVALELEALLTQLDPILGFHWCSSQVLKS